MRTLIAAVMLALVPLIGQSAESPASLPLLAQAKAAQIDINRATVDELKQLKGIGDARAEAIVKGRPYKRKDELVQRNIVPQAVYDQIKDQIVARQ